MADKNIKEQIKIIHGTSPELYDFLMDVIQDAQSLGSIIQIVTIIPPFLELSENGERKFKTYISGCSPNTPEPMKINTDDCSPNQAVEPMK